MPIVQRYPYREIRPHVRVFYCHQKNFEHVFNAAKAPLEATCNYFLDKVKVNQPDGYQKLMQIDVKLWAYYARRNNRVWDQVTTNMVETSNNMIGAAVSIPIKRAAC